MTSERLALALDLIERREARLLAWGITDRGLTEEDLEELLSPVGDGDVETLISDLKSRALIFEVPRSYPVVYRSRMAEGVRLFSQLRQWFPNRSWQDAGALLEGVFCRVRLDSRLGGCPETRRGDPGLQ